MLVLAVGGGCLSTAHRIPPAELKALAQVPPERRGARVWVVQAFAGDEPPPAPAVREGTPVQVGVHGGITVEGSVGRLVTRDLAKAASEEAKWWLVLAAFAGIGLAASEGARYDGWVALHPMHPVHLYGPNGEYVWMPLAQIDVQTAAWARRAYVRRQEGPWTPLGRRPLDRVGWTYSLLLGAARIPSTDGSDEAGFFGHIQFGRFFVQEVGLVADIGLGWRDNAFGYRIYNPRYALELEFLPLAAGRFHAGVFGQAGFATRLEDDPMAEDGTSSMLFGAGVLAQLEITTRLAITFRAGMSSLHGERSTDATVGLSIY